MAKADLSAESLRELLHYDLETGLFTRIGKAGRKGKIGAAVGWEDKDGYIQVGVLCRNYRAHRLAWLYVTGDWPREDVDHINGIRGDNRWSNLRAVTRAVNMQNVRRARKDSSIGLIGVEKNGGGYSARIKTSTERLYLGFFDTPEEAHAAYLDAKRRLHEGCTI